MYAGCNPSALRSRKEIVQAFLSLMQSISIEDITIKQLMDATGLSRQTFYQIFNSKDEILEFYLDTIFNQFIIDSKQHAVKNLCDAAKLFFTFFEDYKDILRIIIQNNKSGIVQRKCREYLQDKQYINYALHGVLSDLEQEYATIFIISGIVAMLEHWIRADSNQIPDTHELALLVCRITGTYSS